MKTIFQKNLQFGDICSQNRQKIAQIDVFDHFLDFASLVFLDFAPSDMWAWCLVVFLQFAGPVNVFLFYLEFTPCKAEQGLQGLELQEKKAQKDWTVQEISVAKNCT